MLGVCYYVVSHKAVDNGKKGILQGAAGIEMPSMSNRVVRCKNDMGSIWPHDPELHLSGRNELNLSDLQSCTLGQKNCLCSPVSILIQLHAIGIPTALVDPICVKTVEKILN